MSGTGFGWADRLVSDVRSAAKPRGRRTQAVSRLNLEVTAATSPLLAEAARRRGIAPTGYLRRAVLAFIAHDLNMSLEAVLKTDPRFSPPGSRRVVVDPEGKFGGPWDIEDLR